MLSLLQEPPAVIAAYLCSILIALCVHEWAHAIVATRLGDPTPHNYGRLTLDPRAHIDPIGALLFLTTGFGWAKPVPINPTYFLHRKRDTLLVAIAGPLSNLILAIIAFILLLALTDVTITHSAWELIFSLGSRSNSSLELFFQIFLQHSLFANLSLMAFNLIPIAPLDGSKVLHAFIPLHFEDVYDEFMQRGPFILLALLLAEYILHIPLLSVPITWIMNLALMGMTAVAGLL